jgi:hypothetical protein
VTCSVVFVIGEGPAATDVAGASSICSLAPSAHDLQIGSERWIVWTSRRASASDAAFRLHEA